MRASASLLPKKTSWTESRAGTLVANRLPTLVETLAERERILSEVPGRLDSATLAKGDTEQLVQLAQRAATGIMSHLRENGDVSVGWKKPVSWREFDIKRIETI
jgi:hypothetical protein